MRLPDGIRRTLLILEGKARRGETMPRPDQMDRRSLNAAVSRGLVQYRRVPHSFAERCFLTYAGQLFAVGYHQALADMGARR